MKAAHALLLAALVAAASTPACTPTPTLAPSLALAPTPAPAPTVSDPEEYQDHGISAAAGEAYFSRLGGGDPYATGIAYPVWLALVEGFPSELGGDVARFADRFGLLVDGAPGTLPHRPAR